MKELIFSPYLEGCTERLRALLETLQQEYDFVSILSTDCKGQRYSAMRTLQSAAQPSTVERGHVVRLCKDGYWFEYSFNIWQPLSEMVQTIRQYECEQRSLWEEQGIEPLPTPMQEEETLTQTWLGTAEISLSEMDGTEVLQTLSNLAQRAHQEEERVSYFRATFSLTEVHKSYLSVKRDLRQSYSFAEGHMEAAVRQGKRLESDLKGFSLLGGAELLDRMERELTPFLAATVELLSADRIEPGCYDIITSPEVSGIIAHEAFGHGVEMDLFVKERAMGAAFVHQRVASPVVSMHEGALAARDTASFFFDDEGVLAGDVLEIENGILQTGIADQLSAYRLGIAPTGNGRRESFERKAYTRMTNTIFAGGKDTLEDMIASIEYGYLLEGASSGMEDPRNWGIQCILVRGREIRDGRLTGRIVSPVVLTGSVPELLQSISMATPRVETCGLGYCGKGYKEWVKVSDGGPYLKAKGRLGS